MYAILVLVILVNQAVLTDFMAEYGRPPSTTL